MFSLTALFITGALALIGGIAIGILYQRTLAPQEQQKRSLENRLREKEQALADYQQQVTEHFASTATLVNNLTQSYKDVHEHLIKDALELANVDISRQLLSNTTEQNTTHSTTYNTTTLNQTDTTMEPPKDWAPKQSDSEGMLSESYGLEREEDLHPPR